MLVGLGAVLYVRFFTDIAWTWYVVIGAVCTFSTGWLLGRLMPPAESPGTSDAAGSE
jgi:hypothetical protein